MPESPSPENPGPENPSPENRDTPKRDLRPGHPEQWSERYQTLRHGGEKRSRDDQALLHNPADYSAVGGPDDERVYGRTRSDNGYYPWTRDGGAYDRDNRIDTLERGGYFKQQRRRITASA